MEGEERLTGRGQESVMAVEAVEMIVEGIKKEMDGKIMNKISELLTYRFDNLEKIIHDNRKTIDSLVDKTEDLQRQLDDVRNGYQREYPSIGEAMRAGRDRREGWGGGGGGGRVAGGGGGGGIGEGGGGGGEVEEEEVDEEERKRDGTIK